MADQLSLGGIAADAGKQKAVRGRRAWAALLLCAASMGSVWAQSAPVGFPGGPVKIVVPFGPGSGSDIANHGFLEHAARLPQAADGMVLACAWLRKIQSACAARAQTSHSARLIA